MKSFTTYGHVTKKGKLKIYNLDVWQHQIETIFPRTSVQITIQEKPMQINDKIRAYYFAVIVPQMQQAYEHAGYQFSKKQIDEWLRSKFLYEEIFDVELEQFIEQNHTLKKKPDSKVTPKMFTKFIDDCIQLASERFGWQIPYPNEEIN